MRQKAYYKESVRYKRRLMEQILVYGWKEKTEKWWYMLEAEHKM